MKYSLILSTAGVLGLTACSTTLPVAVIGSDGQILTGTNTYSLSEGSFSVAGDTMTCSGSYNPLAQSRTISIPVVCSDGRKGFVRSIRDTASSGSGTFRLNDGYQGDFVFGRAAENF